MWIVYNNSLWDNFKRSNICIIGVPEREGKEQEIGNLFEKIMKENFPNLVKEIDIQIQEAQSPKQSHRRGPHQDTLQLNYPRLKISRES